MSAVAWYVRSTDALKAPRVRVLAFAHAHRITTGDWEVRGFYSTETEAAIARDHSKYKDRIRIVRLTGEAQI